MANETLHMNADGITALRQREGVALRYYNDIANNCTFGVGVLAHLGPCTAEELQRPVTAQQVNSQLAMRVQAAEQAVRRQVNQQTLTQEQFNSLVSYVYNAGATGARAALNAANRGVNEDVVMHMNSNVYIHPRDAKGRRLPAKRIQGLVNRRREEAAPFLVPQINP